MTLDVHLESEHYILVENMAYDLAGKMGISVKTKLIDGLSIGCSDVHMLLIVHEAKKHYVLLHQDLSNARVKVNETLSRIKTQLEQ